jgi:hypothetical protein
MQCRRTALEGVTDQQSVRISLGSSCQLVSTATLCAIESQTLQSNQLVHLLRVILVSLVTLRVTLQLL